jgi:RecA/RadA recombinase
MSEEQRKSEDILESYLKENKKDHYNFEETVDYKVTSGSLQFDAYLGGGFSPGLHRFTGINEGGKTSESLEVMKNFLTTIPNSRGIYIKAEGRLGPEMQERSGVTFAFDKDNWNDGTCFVYETNIYESAMGLVRTLITDNPDKKRYCFIVDSMDGLIRRDDFSKGFEDATKVAGGAVVASDFCKKTSVALGKRGHMAIFISQVRADIKIDPYSKAPVRQTTATGGNALLHFANTIIEFDPRFKGDLILQNPSIKTMDAKKNPIIGHHAKVTIKKSPNEKTNSTISYPIRYGRKGGNSIWREKEIVGMLWGWDFLIKKGAWLYPTQEFLELLSENDLEFPEKIQGEPKLFSYIEGDKKLSNFLFDYFKEEVTG